MGGSGEGSCGRAMGQQQQTLQERVEPEGRRNRSTQSAGVAREARRGTTSPRLAPPNGENPPLSHCPLPTPPQSLITSPQFLPGQNQRFITEKERRTVGKRRRRRRRARCRRRPVPGMEWAQRGAPVEPKGAPAREGMMSFVWTTASKTAVLRLPEVVVWGETSPQPNIFAHFCIRASLHAALPADPRYRAPFHGKIKRLFPCPEGGLLTDGDCAACTGRATGAQPPQQRTDLAVCVRDRKP